MRATVNQPKTPVGNTEKSLRLPLEKLKSNNFLSSSRVRAINGKRLKRLFMSKVRQRTQKVYCFKSRSILSIQICGIVKKINCFLEDFFAKTIYEDILIPFMKVIYFYNQHQKHLQKARSLVPFHHQFCLEIL